MGKGHCVISPFCHVTNGHFRTNLLITYNKCAIFGIHLFRRSRPLLLTLLQRITKFVSHKEQTRKNMLNVKKLNIKQWQLN